MMKKKGLIALVLLATIALAGCGGSKKDDVQKSEDTKANSTLIVGFDQAFPPMGFKDDKGGFTGFDIELAQMAAKKMNMDVKLQPIDWDSKDAELNSGNINCIWNGFTMTGREGKYEFSVPYMKNRQVLVVKKGSTVKSLADMKGKRLELQQGSTADNALAEKKDFKESLGNVTTVPENLTALSDLEQGSCDAVLMDEIVARYIIKQGRDFVVIDDPISEEEYAVGFKLGNKDLANQINKALNDLAGDGELAKLSQKYFGQDISIIKK